MYLDRYACRAFDLTLKKHGKYWPDANGAYQPVYAPLLFAARQTVAKGGTYFMFWLYLRAPERHETDDRYMRQQKILKIQSTPNICTGDILKCHQLPLPLSLSTSPATYRTYTTQTKQHVVQHSNDRWCTLRSCQV